MPKYARLQPPDALGNCNMPHWYDTDMLKYPNLPNKSELITMNEEEWAKRFTHYFYSDGEFIEPPLRKNLPSDCILEATAAYAESDSIVLRYYEEGKPVPDSWKQYRRVLRDIMDKSLRAIELPIKPYMEL